MSRRKKQKSRKRQKAAQVNKVRVTQKNTPNKPPQKLWLKESIHLLTAVSKKMWAVVGILAVIVTLSGVFALFPKVIVTPSVSLKETEPFSTTFTISNEGYFSVYDVTFRCHIRNITDESGAKVIAFEKGIRPTGFSIPVIASGEKSTVACPFPFEFNNPVIGADFDFVVVFRPTWFPFMFEKPFRFATAKTKEGQFIWLPRSTSEQ